MKAMAELLTICHRDNLVQESGPSSVGNDTEKVKKANARDKVLLRMPGIKNTVDYDDCYYVKGLVILVYLGLTVNIPKIRSKQGRK